MLACMRARIHVIMHVLITYIVNNVINGNNFQLNWSDLCEEFPVLHPAQLHYMLSQYMLPPATEVPKHWTPTKEDALHALTGGMPLGEI